MMLLLGVLENPVETGIVVVVTSLLNTGVWAYVWKRRLDQKGETTALREWKEYAAQLRSDMNALKDEKDEEIGDLRQRSRRCEDRERKLRDRVAALERRAGILESNNDDTPNEDDDGG